MMTGVILQSYSRDRKQGSLAPGYTNFSGMADTARVTFERPLQTELKQSIEQMCGYRLV